MFIPIFYDLQRQFDLRDSFLSPLFLIIIALPDYLRQLYCVITKKPALELTKDLLIDNSKGHIYKWTEIQGAFYKPYTGYKALPSGYIEITFVGSDKKVILPNNAIKGKTEKILTDLHSYLNYSKN